MTDIHRYSHHDSDVLETSAPFSPLREPLSPVLEPSASDPSARLELDHDLRVQEIGFPQQLIEGIPEISTEEEIEHAGQDDFALLAPRQSPSGMVLGSVSPDSDAAEAIRMPGNSTCKFLDLVDDPSIEQPPEPAHNVTAMVLSPLVSQEFGFSACPVEEVLDDRVDEVIEVLDMPQLTVGATDDLELLKKISFGQCSDFKPRPAGDIDGLDQQFVPRSDGGNTEAEIVGNSHPEIAQTVENVAPLAQEFGLRELEHSTIELDESMDVEAQGTAISLVADVVHLVEYEAPDNVEDSLDIVRLLDDGIQTQQLRMTVFEDLRAFSNKLAVLLSNPLPRKRGRPRKILPFANLARSPRKRSQTRPKSV